MKYSNFSKDKDLINIYPQVIIDATIYNFDDSFSYQLSNKMIGYLYVSCTPMKYRVLWIEIVDWLSQWITLGSSWCRFKSSKILLNQTPWQVLEAVAIYSAFQENIVGNGCFFEFAEMAPKPTLKI